MVGKRSPTMDRLLASKLAFYVALGLAAAYVWANFEWLRNSGRMLIVDWWH
jgi:hypothetical protein